jgi:hypothetical protein
MSRPFFIPAVAVAVAVAVAGAGAADDGGSGTIS